MKKKTLVILGIVFGLVLIGISITTLITIISKNTKYQEKLEDYFETKTPIPVISQVDTTPSKTVVEIENPNKIYKAVYNGKTVLIDTRHNEEYITYKDQPNYSFSNFEEDEVSNRELIFTSEEKLNVYNFLDYKDRIYLSLFSGNEYFLYEFNSSTNEKKLLYSLNSEKQTAFDSNNEKVDGVFQYFNPFNIEDIINNHYLVISFRSCWNCVSCDVPLTVIVDLFEGKEKAYEGIGNISFIEQIGLQGYEYIWIKDEENYDCGGHWEVGKKNVNLNF